MKSYYELKDKELEKYREEFSELDFSKKSMTQALVIVFVGLAVIILVAVLNFIAARNGLSLVFSDFIFALIDVCYIIALVLFRLMYHHDFRRWLKLKYNIE